MVLMQEDKMIAGLVPEEGGGGGHVIQNASGTAVAQQPTMQFSDSHVSDDSENDKTIIENIKPLTGAEFDVVTEDGFYAITDEDDATMEDTSADYVEVVGDGEKTYAQLLNELYADADLTKVNVSTATLKIGGSIFNIFGLSNYECYFSAASLNSQLPATEEIRISSSSYYNRYRQGQFSDLSSTKPSNGTKLTLHYGTDSCVTNLINQAKYTYMESGESVESALTYPIRKYSFAGTLNSNGTIAFPNDAPSDLTAVIGAVKSGNGYCEIIPLNQTGKIKGLKVLDTDNTTPITGTFDFTVYYI